MKELLFSITKKDFKVDYFCSGGPGGQHQNKTASGCRITHIASGAVGESREEREQSRNKAIAFKRVTSSPKFQTWLKIKSSELMMEESIESKLEKVLDSKNIKIEVKDEKGRWKVIKESELEN